MRHQRRWIGHVTVAACLLYAVAGLGWTFGMPGFPFGTGDPEMVDEGENAIVASLLGWATPEVAGPWTAVVGAAAALTCVGLLRRWRPRWALISAGAVLSAGLTVVIQDFRPLIVVAYTPILAVGKTFFGWPPDAGFAELYTWPRVNLLLLTLIGAGVAVTTVRYARETGTGCRGCGRRADSARIARLSRVAVAVAVVVPLVYGATRWLWALGFPLGMDPVDFADGQREGVWLAGALLATLGAGGAVLTLGLVQRWGEVFPRWMVGLAGRRVPPMLAVVPATFVSVLVTAAGFMYIRVVVVMGVSVEDMAATLPETLWPVWGAALLTATVAYRRRRRVCAECDGVAVRR
ncbi:hypothetical protein LX16_2622 [Stackebrandtia albiflava]|uniref:Uncharacterized protein n=1 Tax=Stackebrandtia albiflava TaxID=406432 RepID=A0A562V1Y1_9ACTN|nr:hypothetical protein [Stackebrandtia albiflava]TWJ11884.1 hypothetical protein LX16_2622 [Stackebrandtia albiflava]